MKLLIFLLCFTHLCSNAQPPEVLHLHFDKDMYLPGETIWFKAYLYNGSEASTLSTNLYTAIYDADGKLLQQKQYPIMEGTANGDFTLPDSITVNQLQFVAYTKGMQLTDSNNVYSKIITVVSKSNKDSKQLQEVANKINLQFFAEGGNAISDITNYYAYKAWYTNGDPAIIKGIITEEGNSTVIDSFYTNQSGMGKLQLTPRDGKKYQAIWKAEDGQTVATNLPTAIAFGATLHAEQAGNLLYYTVTKNTNAANFNKMYVVAKMGAIQLYEATLYLDELPKTVSKISLDSLPDGLVQLTLLDANKNPIQERVILVTKTSTQPYLTHSEVNSTAKAKNIIELTVPDTLLYNLSASIADVNFYDKINTTTSIQNQLWFSQNIKALAPQINKALQTSNTNEIDLIMLTHGWRKYNINLSGQLTADNYLTLAVHYKEKNYALPRNEKLNLIIKDTVMGKQFYEMKQTTQTSFVKSGLVFYDSASVYYKTNKSKEIENYITLQREEVSSLPLTINKVEPKSYQNIQTQLTTPNNGIDTFLQDYSAKYRNFNEIQTIKTVVLKSKKYGNPITLRTLELDKTYTSGLFSGIARGYQVNVLDDEKAWGSPDIYSYITNVLPMLNTTGGMGNRKLGDRFRGGAQPIKLFVNETEFQHEDLESISVSQLAYIKYIQGIVIGSSFVTTSGALYIYLKKGNDPGHSFLPTMHLKNIKGYDIAKEFFNPDYSDKNSLLQQDKRTTVYWNPYIITDKTNNKVKIEYYNNDISKKLLLTIEGFNEEGKLIHIEKIIENK